MAASTSCAGAGRAAPAAEAVPALLPGRWLEAGLGDLGEACRRAPLLGRPLRPDRGQRADDPRAWPPGMAARTRSASACACRSSAGETEAEAWAVSARAGADATEGQTRLHPHLLRQLRRPTSGCSELAAPMATSSSRIFGRASPRSARAPASPSSALPSSAPSTLQSFIDLGCHSFCMSGYLHDEEAGRFGRWSCRSSRNATAGACWPREGRNRATSFARLRSGRHIGRPGTLPQQRLDRRLADRAADATRRSKPASTGR